MSTQNSVVKESITATSNTATPIKYDMEKITFIVNPIYNDDSNKTIHDLLLNLMQRNSENPY